MGIDFKAIALERTTRWIVGYDLFEKIKSSVNMLMTDTTKTGAEKRQAVIDDLAGFASDFATFVINAAIEVAVVLANRKLGIK